MMSVYLYLKSEVERTGGWTTNERRDKGQVWTEYHFHGSRVYHENGRFHITLSSIDDSLTPDIAAMVESVSINDYFSTYPPRARGVYKGGEGTTAALDFTHDANPRYRITIKGPTLEAVADLYLRIRAGTILPTESWEASQIRPPVAEPPAPRERSWFIRLFSDPNFFR